MAFECIYCTAVGLIKISLLLMYMRIFPTKGFTLGAYILGFMTIGWVIAINCVSIFQCDPIKKAWFPLIAGKCINLKASFVGNAVPNILTDVAILCMPIGQVWKLQVTPTQRASLCFMFLLGSLSVVLLPASPWTSLTATSVLFASIYRFTTIMQFQMTDTTCASSRILFAEYITDHAQGLSPPRAHGASSKSRRASSARACRRCGR